MKRTTTCIGMLLAASLAIAACGRAVDDISPVQAMNLNTGEVKTFSSEGEVPPGWGVCPDTGCTETPPPGVPCQNLGVDVCTKDPNCRLRTLGCSTPGNPGTTPPSQGGSEPSDAAAPMEPEPEDDPIAPPPEPTCEQVCVAKGSLTCDELTDQQACADRDDCQWAQGLCPAMPCASDGTGCDVACPSTCQAKGPVPCHDLDEKTCGARTDCKWELGVCPAMACADPDDPNCVVECKPFCQPDDDVTPPPPTGECNDNSQCGTGQYCHFSEGSCGGVWYGDDTPSSGGGDSGSSDKDAFAPEPAPMPQPDPMPAGGVCKDLPDACNSMYAPVCGCDGKTYGNDCTALGAGVSIAHQGECDQPPPPPPGGSCFDNSQCADSEYCFVAEGCGGTSTEPAPGNGSDAMPYPAGEGICTKRPQGCYEIYSPVCGCDGKTYSNDCDAASAGANIAHIGECGAPVPPPPPKPECVVTGCSGEICAAEHMDSTCEWKDEYDCLKLTSCGLQADGTCGWKKTSAFTTCVAKAQQP